MEKVYLIITVISTLVSIGAFGIVSSLIKKLKKVRLEWDEMNADGKKTERELLEFAQACMDVIVELIKLSTIIKKAFKKKK